MKRRIFSTAILTGVVALLAACSGPESPQEVTQEFWKAAVNGDGRDVVEYSTLTTVERSDSEFIRWKNYQPEWGRVVIDGDEASVVSRFISRESREKVSRKFVTYLIRHDGEWVVDYARTVKSARGGVFADLISQFDRLGQSMAQQFDESADEAGSRMDAMLEELGQEMEEAQGAMSEQATEAMERFSEELRRSMQEFDESLHRSLEGTDDSLTPEEQETLHSAAVNSWNPNQA